MKGAPVADCNRRLAVAAAFAMLAALTAGCGGAPAEPKRPMGTLKGKLTIGGVPLPAKTGIAFQHAETGKLFLAITEADGSFEVEKPVRDMPAGMYGVSVSPVYNRDETGQDAAEEALGDRPSAAPAKTNSNIEVPKKYLNSHESGLDFELQEGPNDRTINLKR